MEFGKAVLPMLFTIHSYLSWLRRWWRRTWSDPGVQSLLRFGAWAGAGFLLSAASLYHHIQTLALGLLWAMPGGWPAVITAGGAIAGYMVFWQEAGLLGVAWILAGSVLRWCLGRLPRVRQTGALRSAAAALTAAAVGVAYLLQRREIPTLVYILQVTMAGISCWLFALEKSREGVFTLAMRRALWVLALSQVVLPGLGSLGFAAAGAMCAVGTFPAAALAGLALDISQVTPVSMTAVLGLAFLLRLLPGQRKWFAYIAPAVAYLPVMVLSLSWDLTPLPLLAAGGLCGLLLSKPYPAPRRRGETAVAQARLELVSGVLTQAESILRETEEPALDEEGLFHRAVESACTLCPSRRECMAQSSVQMLHYTILRRPYIHREDLPPAVCRRPNRLLTELRRGQDQLRLIRRERTRLREYRMALTRQYHFLAWLLRDMSQRLGKPGGAVRARFSPEVAACSTAREGRCGDKCSWFAGVGNRYYVLLCDGMGTGTEAEKESTGALDMLKRLLRSGFPAEYALRSFNDLCVLRGAGGCSTVDLAELCLDTGRVLLYKWGAAPSYILGEYGIVKVGSAAPPPGLESGRETVERLTLGRGESLVLISDGVAGEDALHRCSHRQSPKELARYLLAGTAASGEDDATAVVVRLTLLGTGT